MGPSISLGSVMSVMCAMEARRGERVFTFSRHSRGYMSTRDSKSANPGIVRNKKENPIERWNDRCTETCNAAHFYCIEDVCVIHVSTGGGYERERERFQRTSKCLGCPEQKPTKVVSPFGPVPLSFALVLYLGKRPSTHAPTQRIILYAVLSIYAWKGRYYYENV